MSSNNAKQCRNCAGLLCAADSRASSRAGIRGDMTAAGVPLEGGGAKCF